MQVSRKERTLLLVVSLAPDEIGHRIAEAREAKGWSQLQLALELDVSPSTIYRWESGKLPAVKELMRAAAALDVDGDYLVSPPTAPPAQGSAAGLAEVLEGVLSLQAQVTELRQAVRGLEARLPPPQDEVAADAPD